MANEVAPKIVCWDLDNTLGHFYGYGNQMDGLPSTETDRVIELRYGIKELLQEFSPENGFKHVITTSGRADYADLALTKTGIRGHFSQIFDRKDVTLPNESGKQYFYPALDFVHPYEAYPDRMIAIGDSGGDMPTDTTDLVFILVDDYIRHDALVIREILTALLEEGEGSFKRGFDKLFEKAEFSDEAFPPLGMGEQHEITLKNGITFRMRTDERRGSFYDEDTEEYEAVRVPVIDLIKAEEHQKPPVFIEKLEA